MRRALAATLILVALIATGCGGGDDKAGEKTKTTTTRYPPTLPVNNKQLGEGQGACGLVNRAEIASAVGIQANAGSGVETGDGGSSCKWTLQGSGNQFVSILEVVKDAAAYEERLRAQSGGAIENLTGLGDHAFFASNTVYVVKGTKLIIVAVATTQSAPVRRTATTKLAQSAAARM